MAVKKRLVEIERAPGFEQRLAALPSTPGVYVMRDRAGTIIYIGKAVSLRNRVRTYFGSLKGQTAKVWRMVEMVYDFEYILTDTELEALVLENQMIKQHKPRYNIRLKDDKTYPYIKVTLAEDWPRVVPTRNVTQGDGNAYFGPFPGMSTVYDLIDLLDKLFPFRTCDKEITGKDARPCMQYFLHRCLGPCAGLGDKKSYDDAIKQVVMFLDGKQEVIVKGLKAQMEQAAEELQFERAAVFRDRIRRLESVIEQKRVFTTATADEDVIAFARRDGEACVQIFFIRGGKLMGREDYMLEGTAEAEPSEIMEGFIGQFYEDATYVPPKILVQHEVSDAEVIQAWLRERRGTKVAITVPRRGEKRELVELAARNAAESLEQLRLKYLSDEQKATAALTELQEVLRLPVWPRRIECYDVAHLQGTDVAGAMVVFEQGVPQKKEYRRFQIRTVSNDDYSAMDEMLTRRFKRSAAERAATERAEAMDNARHGNRDEPAPGADFEAAARLEYEQASGDIDSGDSESDVVAKAERGRNGRAQAAAGGWAVLPDLIVIDGGKGQLARAHAVIQGLGLHDIPIISLAKREEEIFLPGQSEPVRLEFRSEALRLLQRVRDEAHRFSNSYNRKLGSRRATRGKLDSVPYVGSTRKKALMARFGTLSAIKQAS
ncbi:MAG TPA: excinuclease ABC subunit UvrC, partial [Chloroflexia bacterium]|nr:excinuclease ABC subunit UvrC [Chloroflexia bacterium]